MAAINVPGYGDIVPLSPEAEVLVKSDDPEHVRVMTPHPLTAACEPHPGAVSRVLQARLGYWYWWR